MTQHQLGPVETPEPPILRFERYLHGQGKRMTSQRRTIVDEVFSHHDHFDADDLMEHLKEKMSLREVSRPTVYRTLAELVDAGLLRRMVLNDRYVYEHEYGYPEHDHLYCQHCRQLFEFHSDILDGVREEVARAHDFTATSHRMIIMGVCARCRNLAGGAKPDSSG